MIFQEFDSDEEDDYIPETIEEALDYLQQIQWELLKEGIM